MQAEKRDNCDIKGQMNSLRISKIIKRFRFYCPGTISQGSSIIDIDCIWHWYNVSHSRKKNERYGVTVFKHYFADCMSYIYTCTDMYRSEFVHTKANLISINHKHMQSHTTHLLATGEESLTLFWRLERRNKQPWSRTQPVHYSCSVWVVVCVLCVHVWEEGGLVAQEHKGETLVYLHVSISLENYLLEPLSA